MVLISITIKNGYGGYTTINREVSSKRHYNNLVDKFYNVVEIDFNEEEFKNLKDK
jgi:hypothetical protein